ncbi:hypothetical protein [Cohnella fermenti]|uniref:GNAT family N-acetyltransferase n=1 Tax=Cohnella fermenti TaxID=2565925 RepID=A0A4S4BEU3_9BACL|nr:hypothetical protein [Cohnella fermenti]THF72709.1 hypothetical protein E6C55_32200 [Cohnella fermenti]
MTITHSRCLTDNELARASLFFFDHRRDVHRSYDTIGTVGILYDSMTSGHLIQSMDKEDGIVGLTLYRLKPGADGDGDVIFIEIAVSDHKRRRSRMFVRGLGYLLELFEREHPRTRRVEFAAYSSDRYLCGLYAKFAEPAGTREDSHGEMTVFRSTIDEIRGRLLRFRRAGH